MRNRVNYLGGFCKHSHHKNVPNSQLFGLNVIFMRDFVFFITFLREFTTEICSNFQGLPKNGYYTNLVTLYNQIN